MNIINNNCNDICPSNSKGRAAAKERVKYRVRPCGKNKHSASHWVCSDPEPFTDGRRAQKLIFNFWDKSWSSLLLINLTAALMHRYDLYLIVFMYCNIHKWEVRRSTEFKHRRKHPAVAFSLIAYAQYSNRNCKKALQALPKHLA